MSSFLSSTNGQKLRSLRQQLGVGETLESSRMDDLLNRIQFKQRELGSSSFLERTEPATKDTFLGVDITQRNKLKDVELGLEKTLESADTRLKEHLTRHVEVQLQKDLANIFSSYRSHLLK